MNVNFSDQALEELSQMFLFDEQDPTPFMNPELARQLDFSIESLLKVEAFLDSAHGRVANSQAFMVLTLRAGAYLGEVIRRNGGERLHWLAYDEASKLSKSVAESGQSLGNCAILWHSAKGEFSFPVGKVLKYVKNGAGDSIKFFAEVVIARSREGGRPTEG